MQDKILSFDFDNACKISIRPGVKQYYFITFTCHKWRYLFSITNTYDAVYKWFDHLYERNIMVLGYVIMPNHLHVLVYFPAMPKSLNIIIGNANRFIA